MGHEKSATSNSQIAQLFGVAAALKRRNSEWRFQLEQANAQLEQIAQQIVAAEARVNAVTTEIRQTEQERDNNDELLTFLQDKFTNEELYDWMITEVTTVYFKSYQLALYVARQTEECWQCEIGSDETFVERFSNWDSAKKGLLAGERLQLQLERMETSYLDDDDRELELTKTIRLSELDPAALARLRETRSCSFSIPEIVYDLDGPGQYFRRLKTVAVTVVHAGGTDMVVPMELTLTKAQVRIRERASGYERTGGGDGDFQDNRYVGDVIALSSGRSDSGLFETSLRDERYLPFERAGAISDWTLAIPSSYAPLRSRDITDIEMHIRFTAREGSDEFRNLVNAYLLDLADEQVQSWKWVGTTLTAYDSRLMHFIRASHDFPDAWAAFKATASGSPSLSVSLPASLKPPVLEGVDLYVARIWVALSIAGDATDFYVDIDFTFGGTPKTLTLAADTTINSQPVGSASYTSTNRPLATSLSAISLDVDIGTWSGELSELEEMLIFFEWVKTA